MTSGEDEVTEARKSDTPLGIAFSDGLDARRRSALAVECVSACVWLFFAWALWTH